MNLDVVASVFRKELRELLRDRRSLAVMIGIPLILYPLVAIGVSSLGQKKFQEQKEHPAQVAFPSAGAAPKLYELLKDESSGIKLVLPDDVDQALQKGEADAAIEVPPATEQKALAGEAAPPITVRLDRSRTQAAFAQRKIDAVLDKYEQWVIEQRLEKRGIPASVLAPVKHTTVDVARGDQVFGKVLSQMLPLLLLMTGMLGALFPALNATTTERELGTLETLLVTPAGRTELLIAKGALVLICGLTTAGLNMLSMSLVLKRALSMVDNAELARNLSISAPALLLTFLAAVPALMFFTTIVLILGLLARNFREANAFATPVMLIPLASLAVGIIEPAPTAGILMTPVANTTVIIREVLVGRATFGAFAMAFASSLVYAGLMLSVAARLFSNEQLVNPAWEPLSMKGFKRSGAKRPRRLPAIDEALGLFVVSLLLLFYVSPSFIRFGLIPIVLVSQLALILAPALVWAWLARWRWSETFSWIRVSPLAVVGGGLVGIGLVPWVQALAWLQNKVWPQAPDESSKLQLKLILDSLTAHPLLTIVLVGALAGLCEELLFRGPIQKALLRKLNPWAAIWITAFLFGAAHMELHGLPARTLLGVALGYIVWRGGSIFPAMLLHALYDMAALAHLWWTVHRVGASALVATGEAGGFDAEMAVMLVAGAALIGIGVWMFRRGAMQREADQQGFRVAPAA
jgi:sodium transport system permease protein